MVTREEIEIGDIVEITNPGRNYSNQWDLARELGAIWYEGIRLSNHDSIWRGTKWRVIAESKEKRLGMRNIFLIRNVFLEQDLIISNKGLTLVNKNPPFQLKDEDLLI